MCWFLVTHICYSEILQELIFVKFIGFYGILLEIKNLNFKFLKNSARPHWRLIGRSTGRVVSRPDRSTDVHETCTKDQPNRLVDQLKALNSRVLPVDQAVDRQAWPVDRRHNGQKYDCCFGFVPCLLCRGGCVGKRSCVLLSLYYQILGGGSLCGHIVEILLCEGGDVEQWLKPRNISWRFRLIHYL